MRVAAALGVLAVLLGLGAVVCAVVAIWATDPELVENLVLTAYLAGSLTLMSLLGVGMAADLS